MPDGVASHSTKITRRIMINLRNYRVRTQLIILLSAVTALFLVSTVVS